MPVDYVGFAYAATVAGGGIYGYLKAGSLPSLGAGLIFGSMLGIGAYQMSKNPANSGLMMYSTSLLTMLMGYRFYQTVKFMPAGLMCIISAGMVGRLFAIADAVQAMPKVN